MSRIVDNLIAFRIMKMLVTPFTDTAAFKLGIIDAHGKNIKRANSLASAEERDAYTYLHRLVFNVKKIINRFPGGDSRLKSLIAGLWLVKETYESGSRSTALLEEKFANVMKMLDNKVCLVEEEILVKKFLEEDVGAGAIGGAPANNTSGPVATQEPKIYSKDVKKYKSRQPTVIAGMTRRPKPLQ